MDKGPVLFCLSIYIITNIGPIRHFGHCIVFDISKLVNHILVFLFCNQVVVIDSHFPAANNVLKIPFCSHDPTMWAKVEGSPEKQS